MDFSNGEPKNSEDCSISRRHRVVRFTKREGERESDRGGTIGNTGKRGIEEEKETRVEGIRSKIINCSSRCETRQSWSKRCATYTAQT